MTTRRPSAAHCRPQVLSQTMTCAMLCFFPPSTPLSAERSILADDMNDQQKATVPLPFSEEVEYFQKLSDYRMEHRMAQRARAFAGNPSSVLNLPCGTGRFWSMLAQDPKRELLAADYSKAVLQVARTTREPCVVQRFRWPQCSAFEITLPDDSVDGIFSIRLMHHIGESTSRVAMPRDFYRVRQDSVVLSPWLSMAVTEAWRRHRREDASGNEERKATTVSLVPRAQFEQECREAQLQDRWSRRLPAAPFHVACVCAAQENDLERRLVNTATSLPVKTREIYFPIRWRASC
jgi:SAM-dependent methyltransferase